MTFVQDTTLAISKISKKETEAYAKMSNIWDRDYNPPILLDGGKKFSNHISWLYKMFQNIGKYYIIKVISGEP
ncbi:hypothetical protein HKBW3S09_00637 [Candidatus Hakubella thermalkaliphila]|uniref:Uncharacterized protein n=1 Tax=Candidatus Hakubella thermalkaliphila TaxID=2754717 RepID=A0A6V8NUQ8_9ACTN|nr:hypothetical protein HKBW3S09_00637 [Candidatus Hakubella thermalkaliphila]